MMTINVKDALLQAKQLKKLTGPELGIVISRAINKTLLKGRTQARSAVKAVYNIPQNKLDNVGIIKSNRNLLIGKINASTNSIPLDVFSPTYTFQSSAGVITRRKVSRKGKVTDKLQKRGKVGAGVNLQVFKGKSVNIPYAFMLPGKGAKVYARGKYGSGGGKGFIRRYKRTVTKGSDVDIAGLLSVSTYATIMNPGVMGKINRMMVDDMPRQVTSAILSLKFNPPRV